MFSAETISDSRELKLGFPSIEFVELFIKIIHLCIELILHQRFSEIVRIGQKSISYIKETQALSK